MNVTFCALLFMLNPIDRPKVEELRASAFEGDCLARPVAAGPL